VCSPKTVDEFSAIGYVFARRLHMATQVPIGVIDTSRGGTTIETWTPEPVLRQSDAAEVKAVLAEWDRKVADFDPKKDLADRVAKFNEQVEKMKQEGKPIPADMTAPMDLRPGPAADQNRPGNCYAAMIAPLAGFAVKGAIWHQGYNNCFNGTAGAILYAQVFPKMIAAWRAAFQDPAMPFGILSLCTQEPLQTRDNFLECMADAGPFIREAQYQTFLALYKAGDTNVGYASTYDLRRRWYHPQLKIPAGERMARWALATQYGFDRQIRWKPPMVVEMKVEDGRILLQMDEPVGAVDDGSPIQGFAVAGEDRRFQPADAEHLITGTDDRGQPRRDAKVLALSSPLVPHPVHYRYAWARCPMANVQAQHNSDLPLATQRSDPWALEETPAPRAAASGPEDRAARKSAAADVRKALVRLDRERRAQEAERVLAELRPLLEEAPPDGAAR
jgi:sialate O-acetylesterase